VAPPLKVLHLEENAADAKLVLSILEGDGIACESMRVDSRGAFESALQGCHFDVIISDFSLPSFEGLSALAIARRNCPQVPFIFVSGTISEKSAMTTLQHGATDYILKQRLARLPAAVRRALDETRQRSARGHIHQALHEAQERFRGIYNSSKDAIGYATLDGALVDVNQSFLRLTGYSQEELIKKTYQQLTPDEYKDTEAEIVERIIKTGEPAEYEKEFIRKDGSRVSIALTAFVVKGPDGTPLGLAAIIKDITERKRLEQQFRQAQKMEAVGQLAGGIAHDFNNLLTVINGYSDMLLMRLAEDDSGRGEIEQIREAGRRAAALTAKLLAFSRKEMVRLQVLNLNEVVSGVEKLLRRLIGEDIDLVTNPEQDLGYINADPCQMEQVILNLAVNARDAMPRGGRLTIDTRNVELDAAFSEADMPVTPGSYVMLSVADTGSGMDEATRTRMFEPFFTTKEPGKGTGLGLATVYGVIKQGHGYISVSSQPGTGTTFTLYLPRVWPGAVEQSAGHHSTSRRVGTETILLVEDEPPVRAFIRDALRLNGYVVLEARHGIEAMMLSRQHVGVIHLLLTDVIMPQISGRELADRLQAERPDIKVLYVSGYMDDASLRHGISTLEKVLLQKPFTTDVLARKVRDILDGQP
jgi:two-component system cell cycle sensor histidine kinase/response regulator CckA